MTGPDDDISIDLDTRLYVPKNAGRRHPQPAILMTCGFGLTKASAGVVSTARFFAAHGYVVLPCTTTDRQLPFHPSVESLGQPNFAICDHVTSIGRQRLARCHSARLSPDEIAVIKCVFRQLIDTR